MNDNIDLEAEYAACAELVRAFRAQYSAYWPTPSPEDCLRYAVSEVGEAMSDWLREMHPDHKRNNARTPDVAGELGDTLIMLVSVPVDDYSEAANDYLAEPFFGIDELALATAQALYEVQFVVRSDYNRTAGASCAAMRAIAERGRSPREVVAERLDAIWAKHVLRLEDGQP